MKNKIIIVLLIVLVIIGIWFYKNGANLKDNKTNGVEIRKASSSSGMEITKLDLEELKSYKMPIILDFGADGCPACDTMYPYLEEIYEEMQGKAIIKTMDVWKHPNLANGYPVELIPTQFFFNSDGTPFVPEKPEELNFEIIEDDSGNHVLTRHIGILTVEEMRNVLKEMGLDG